MSSIKAPNKTEISCLKFKLQNFSRCQIFDPPGDPIFSLVHLCNWAVALILTARYSSSSPKSTIRILHACKRQYLRDKLEGWYAEYNAAVQSIELYGAELWWKGQKNLENEVQLPINRQARAIMGMWPSTPISPFVKRSGIGASSDFAESPTKNVRVPTSGYYKDSRSKWFKMSHLRPSLLTTSRSGTKIVRDVKSSTLPAH